MVQYASGLVEVVAVEYQAWDAQALASLYDQGLGVVAVHLRYLYAGVVAEVVYKVFYIGSGSGGK